MYYAFTQKSVMWEIAKIVRKIKLFESGYSQEEIEQLAAEIDMSEQSEEATITEDSILVDGGRRLLALLLLGHTHIRVNVVKIEEQHIRKLMRSLNFTRDKKNFEKIKEALLIYKEIERHQGKKTGDRETPIQKAIRISGAETSNTNFYKYIYVEQTDKLLPKSKLLTAVEKGDLKIDKAYESAQKLRQNEKERLELLEKKEKGKSQGTNDDTNSEATAITNDTDRGGTTPDNTVSADTTSNDNDAEDIDTTEDTDSAGGPTDDSDQGDATSEDTNAEDTTTKDTSDTTIRTPRIIPLRKHIILSPQCHIINESNLDLPEIEDGSIDMDFESPPYWQQMKYGNPDELGQEKYPEEYLDKLFKIYEARYPKISNRGNLLINMKGTNNLLEYPYIEERFVIGMGQRGYYLRDKLVWFKKSVGRQSSKFDRQPENSYEPIFWFVKSNDYYFNPYPKKVRDTPCEITIKKVERTNKKGTSIVDKLFINRAFESFTNVIRESEFWDIITTDARPKESDILNKYYGEHPAPFPMCLPLLPALQFCPKHGRMIDGFMGRGAGLVASLMLGHTVYGYELNPEYFESAKSILSDLIVDIDLYSSKMSELIHDHIRTEEDLNEGDMAA